MSTTHYTPLFFREMSGLQGIYYFSSQLFQNMVYLVSRSLLKLKKLLWSKFFPFRVHLFSEGALRPRKPTLSDRSPVIWTLQNLTSSVGFRCLCFTVFYFIYLFLLLFCNKPVLLCSLFPYKIINKMSSIPPLSRTAPTLSLSLSFSSSSFSSSPIQKMTLK